MSLEYIREYYKVPAYEGQAVTFQGKPAVIVGASNQYLKLHFDNDTDPAVGRYHPTWEIVYLEKEAAR